MKILKLTVPLFVLLLFSNNINSQNLTNYLITSNSIGTVKLGMTINEFKESHSHMKIEIKKAWKYGVDGEGNGWLLSDNEKELIFVWSKNDSTIGGIYCLSDKFTTTQGIKIGMKITELIKLYPKIILKQDYMNEYIEFFYIQIEPINENLPNPDGSIVTEFYSINKESVGDYSDSDEFEQKTEKFNHERTIDRIAIWE